tara:strand:- start:5240 stop:6022 length:783 start_codon:yes stop_codon:yes gene_type:complete
MLPRAINSVFNQTYDPLEIIVVDDGSTDNTKEWLLNNYPRIRYKYQPNLGVSSARNAGIKIARGDWIGLLDSDDEWLPNKLERQINALKVNQNSFFCHTNETWIRNGVRINQGKKHQKYGGLIFEKCLDICRISPSSVLLKKSILDDIGLFDEKLPVCEDYDLWLRIAARHPILFLDESLIYKYGGHRGQLSKISGGIEQYRIQSIEKILKTTELNSSQANSARKMLLKKLKIYLKGLIKRRRFGLAHEITKKIEYWTLI